MVGRAYGLLPCKPGVTLIKAMHVQDLLTRRSTEHQNEISTLTERNAEAEIMIVSGLLLKRCNSFFSGDGFIHSFNHSWPEQLRHLTTLQERLKNEILKIETREGDRTADHVGRVHCLQQREGELQDLLACMTARSDERDRACSQYVSEVRNK
jgi:hypothetical protein